MRLVVGIRQDQRNEEEVEFSFAPAYTTDIWKVALLIQLAGHQNLTLATLGTLPEH